MSLALVLSGWLIVILLIPGDKDYWENHDTLKSFLIAALSLALLASHSYTSTLSKGLALILAVYSVFALTTSLVTDYVLGADVSGYLVGWMSAFAFLSMYAMRYIIRFTPSPYPHCTSSMFLVVGRPTDAGQVLAAIRTGLGGSFAITDMADIWKFPKETGVLTKSVLDPGYLNGKMLIELTQDSDTIKSDLEKILGKKWSFFYNCLEFYLLAKRLKNGWDDTTRS